MATYADEPGYEIFNLASGVPTSIRELAEMACQVGKLETDILETESRLQNADDKVVLSIQRIKEFTQWPDRNGRWKMGYAKHYLK